MIAEGDIIGAYRVLGKLGEGGAGVVYAAEHTLLGRRAAVKVIQAGLSHQRPVIDRFFREARTLTQLADPGIVQVFDFGFHADGSAFIVMELLEGEPMDRRLRRVGRFHVIEALRIGKLICQSMAAAHAKGIVHRDLKPENLYLVGDPAVTGREQVKVLDFGIAKLTVSHDVSATATGALLGTPVYMSPEQARGAGKVDARADIYSLGCVLTTMLTGSPPFFGDGFGDLIVAHLQSLPPRPSSRVPELPAAVDALVLRCLEKDPAQRFQTMIEVASAIDKIELAALNISQVGQSARAEPFVPSVPTTLTIASGQHTAALASSTSRRLAVAMLCAAAIALVLAMVRRGYDDPVERRIGDGGVEMVVRASVDAEPPPDAAAPHDSGPDASVVNPASRPTRPPATPKRAVRPKVAPPSLTPPVPPTSPPNLPHDPGD